MPATPINLGGQEIAVHKSTLKPKFSEFTVLASDFWKYVELYLRREKADSAVFYWDQARQFYNVSNGMNELSSPLTKYYCFLNATKALLECKNVKTSPSHGTSGKSTTKKATISGEKVKFHKGGVAPALSRILGDTDARESYSLKQIFYNLVFIHRAFVLTFKKEKEMFAPIRTMKYVKKDGSSESWINIEVNNKFKVSRLGGNIPAGFELASLNNENIFRTKNRFKWKEEESEESGNLLRIANYNSRIRKNVVYIRGQPPLWYMKFENISANSISRSSLTLMLAAMHRLSELSRYNPLRLKLLLETQQNWLISEFINSAPAQFLDEISTEITGQNLAIPYVVSSR